MKVANKYEKERYQEYVKNVEAFNNTCKDPANKIEPKPIGEWLEYYRSVQARIAKKVKAEQELQNLENTVKPKGGKKRASNKR